MNINYPLIWYLSTSIERDQLSTGKELADYFLHFFETHEPAALAPEMIEQSSQSGEFFLAATIWAVAVFLVVSWRPEVLIEVVKLPVLFAA